MASTRSRDPRRVRRDPLGAGWHFSPPTGTGVVADIVAVEIAVPDPVECARRWATLLDVPGGTTGLDLGGRELRFVSSNAGQSGLVAVELDGLAELDHILCGVRFLVIPAAGA